MARRKPTPPSRGRSTRGKAPFKVPPTGKTFLHPVIEEVGRATKAFTNQQMKALVDMKNAAERVEGYIRPSDRNR